MKQTEIAHKAHQRRIISIDPGKLRQLASNPAHKSNSIPAMFGVSQSQFFRYLNNSPSLWAVWVSARAAAGIDVKNLSKPRHRTVLSADEILILEVIAGLAPEDRTASRIRTGAIASGVEPARFGPTFYILEHEKHEIWSQANGVTRYFLRDEEAQLQKSDVRSQMSAKEAA
jgi:hypothetical protein